MRIIHIKDKKTVRDIAVLHQTAFPEFFLTQLGLPFLKTLYNGYIDDANSGIIAAENAGKIIGFIAYSNNYPDFFRGLIKHKIIQFAGCSILAVIRHPSFAKRLIAAFRKGDSVIKKERYVELSSICVAPEREGQGIGSALLDYLKSIVDFDTYAYINLETDADHNEKANRFYRRNGFILCRVYTTAEGRRMNEYRYALRRSDLGCV